MMSTLESGKQDELTLGLLVVENRMCPLRLHVNIDSHTVYPF